MTQFLTPGVKSDIPSWLPDIVTYLKDFIGGRYKSKMLAQSSKMIVKILERLIKSDLENSKFKPCTVNHLYTNTQYNDKICYSDNLTGRKSSLKR